jgi:ion channel-forming bestrophin family protein
VKVYNPKDWILVILKSHNSQVFRQMNRMLLFISILSGVIVYELQDYLHLADTHPLKNTVILQSLLGFAISILLVFRTNTAYDRWWEGRKLWGNLVNNSRNFALKINSIFHENEEVKDFYNKIIPLYAKSLMHHLLAEKTRLMLDEIDHPEFEIDMTKHVPNQIAGRMMDKLFELNRNSLISSEQLLFINPEISSFTDVCGGCERIKNTPIPYSYSAFIKKIVFFYILSLPIGLSFSLSYYCIPIVALVFYVMVGLELVAEEIEDPFGGDENDLPMEKICTNIQKHVNEILG